MSRIGPLCCALILFPVWSAAEGRPAADAVQALQQVSLDPEQTYRVRDLELTRGDLKIYLTEGILSFVTPVAGRRVAVMFTTQGVDAGDAEILALPPQRSERASLAHFTNSPNLDEHFRTAAFFFSDDTAGELLKQIQAKPTRKAPDLAVAFGESRDVAVRNIASALRVRLIKSLFDLHPPTQGFFYGLFDGRTLGGFQVLYTPDEADPIEIGPISASDTGKFTLWTAFRPRHAPPYVRPEPRISEYHIDTTVHPDLSMSVTAAFDFKAQQSDGRAIALDLADELKIDQATVDGKAAERVEGNSIAPDALNHGRTFVLLTADPLSAGSVHKVEIRYSGSVIRATGDRTYSVNERNDWFPLSRPTLANFDLTFHYPALFGLVSTGELVSEELQGEQRVMHRKTQVPEALAGFNLGEYERSVNTQGPYRVECYFDRASGAEMADIPQQTENVLQYYTDRWMKLPIHSIAVSPVPGYFGEGFPGLIYLSNISYLRAEDRPVPLRRARLEAFFSELLLPHEVAHQWWGNIVTPANYRSAWIMEAMANDAALEFIEHTRGAAPQQEILEIYREDLLHLQNGKPLETAGPVTFGERLRGTTNDLTWHVITYEKGAWILHMLRERLGAEGYHQMQLRLLENFRTQPVTNEDLMKTASQFVPQGEPDRSLSLFFETWVYGTGVPKLALKRTRTELSLDVSGVDEDFAADVPIHCQSNVGKDTVHWMRISAGSNDLMIPPGSAGCTLPPSNEFLYSQ